jgi:hypothetical protein
MPDHLYPSLAVRRWLPLILMPFLAGALSAADGPLPLRMEEKTDRLVIQAGGKLFTEYLYPATEKYPYFYPVIGPRSGQSVTTRREPEYPHHSSIFFGCDRVNGGNYWQEGLERGRIAHQSIKVLQAAGESVVFEQNCRWERPNAEAPFDDWRRITIAAPARDVRCIDFEVKLTARTKVKIEKTNHSLFSARMAPDLCVRNGGQLINAAGDSGEKATFGKTSPWMDYRGRRGEFFEGVTLFDHARNPWTPTQWFTRDYGFFSPSPMNWLAAGLVEFAPGETIRLRYRILVHAHSPGREQLEAEYQKWIKE